MIAQITADGAISADYTVTVLIGAVGFMLLSFGSLVSWAAIRALKQVEVQLKQLTERVDKVVDNHNELEREFIEWRAKTPSAEILAAQIALKLKAISAMNGLE